MNAHDYVISTTTSSCVNCGKALAAATVVHSRDGLDVLLQCMRTKLSETHRRPGASRPVLAAAAIAILAVTALLLARALVYRSRYLH